MYKNRHSPVSNIKVKTKLYSKSLSNGMVYPIYLNRHSTSNENNLKESSSRKKKARKIKLT